VVSDLSAVALAFVELAHRVVGTVALVDADVRGGARTGRVRPGDHPRVERRAALVSVRSD
jgi:hypothetical protein